MLRIVCWRQTVDSVREQLQDFGDVIKDDKSRNILHMAPRATTFWPAIYKLVEMTDGRSVLKFTYYVSFQGVEEEEGQVGDIEEVITQKHTAVYQ